VESEKAPDTLEITEDRYLEKSQRNINNMRCIDISSLHFQFADFLMSQKPSIELSKLVLSIGALLS